METLTKSYIHMLTCGFDQLEKAYLKSQFTIHEQLLALEKKVADIEKVVHI